jgi:hypothetical protein
VNAPKFVQIAAASEGNEDYLSAALYALDGEGQVWALGPEKGDPATKRFGWTRLSTEALENER